MGNRKLWTSQQAEPRKLLSSRARFGEVITLFTSQHAALQTAEISGGLLWSLHDEVNNGLSPSQINQVFILGQNSNTWLWWHIARIEEMTINSPVLNQPLVSHSYVTQFYPFE